MNPDGTNPTTNTGATGGSNAGSVVPPALDFTSSETTSLSMADSLASAADNLTSAGMAAKEPDTGSIEMNEIGASDPSAQMERPDEPLVPAAPVPGSIGSVTSGPAVTAHDDATAAPAGGAMAGSAAKPFGGAGISSPAGASAVSGAATFGTPSATGFSSPAVPSFSAAAGTSGAGVTGASTTGTGANMAGTPSMSTANEPYNPFAAKMGTTSESAQTSSMNVPTGSQPATEKFSAKLPSVSMAKKPAMLTVILGILAVVSLVMAIVFAILWQNAEANKDVVYEPPVNAGDGAANQTVAMVTCTKNLGPDEAGVMAGLTDHNMAATVSFSNDQLGSVTMLNKYTFVDAAAVEAMRTYFNGTLDWYGTVAEGSGVTAGAVALDIADAVATLSLTATPEQLAGEYATLFGLTVGEDGKLDASREAIEANYIASGFACVED